MSVNNHVIVSKQAIGPWWEILMVMTISLLVGLIDARLKAFSIIIPLAYLLIERPLRKRTWAGMGFTISTTPVELLRNLGWVLLVGVGIQALVIFGAKFFLPDFFTHVTGRLPFDANTLGVVVVVALLFSTLGEEIIFRALFQGRLAAFLPLWAAIGLSSVVFGLMHFAPGPAFIVLVDIALVVLDSILYGIIFARSNNVFVAWIAHFLADVTGIFLLWILVM